MTTPLWPQPIPVLGLTGAKWSGKTLFSLSIAGPDTLIYDTELSSASYIDQIGATRIDVMGEMHKLYPKGHTAMNRFMWWLNHVRDVPAGKYKVIVCDTVNEIESGLADWVKANPPHFGHSAAQYLKMSGLMWADVKDHWLNIIASDLKGRCETFVFVTHLGQVWGSDNKPTGKMKPKGKETLFQVASLYLEMKREKDIKGSLPSKPAAIVLKDRIAAMKFDPATGEMVVKPLLPPRLPVATPAEIRRIMAQGGIDFATLTPDQMAPDEQMTDDDRAAVKLATAEAERDTEQARLARTEAERARTQQRTPPPPAPPTANVPPVTAPTPTTNGTPRSMTDAITDDQLSHLVRLRARLWEAAGDATKEAQTARWADVLSKRGVKSAKELTGAQADDLIGKLAERLNKEEPMDKVFRGEVAIQGSAGATAEATDTDGADRHDGAATVEPAASAPG